MIDISSWLDKFLVALDKAFGERIWFVGLQGSYARNEATNSSDIDVVVILDELTSCDIEKYGNMLNGLDNRELICGFISGKSEIFGWEPSDLFQFYYDTKAIKGSLDALLPLLDEDAIKRAIKTGACNIYHGCVHNMLHEKSEEILKGLYKSASFTVQARVFLQAGKYVRYLKELVLVSSHEDKEIIEMLMQIKNGATVDFNIASDLLFNWARALI